MAVNRDSTEGIIARFRTLAISPTSVLNGHVTSAVIRTLVSVALVIGVSIGLGFRPSADAGQWLAVAGLTVIPSSIVRRQISGSLVQPTRRISPSDAILVARRYAVCVRRQRLRTLDSEPS